MRDCDAAAAAAADIQDKLLRSTRAVQNNSNSIAFLINTIPSLAYTLYCLLTRAANHFTRTNLVFFRVLMYV